MCIFWKKSKKRQLEEAYEHLEQTVNALENYIIRIDSQASQCKGKEKYADYYQSSMIKNSSIERLVLDLRDAIRDAKPGFSSYSKDIYRYEIRGLINLGHNPVSDLINEATKEVKDKTKDDSLSKHRAPILSYLKQIGEIFATIITLGGYLYLSGRSMYGVITRQTNSADLAMQIKRAGENVVKIESSLPENRSYNVS